MQRFRTPVLALALALVGCEEDANKTSLPEAEAAEDGAGRAVPVRPLRVQTQEISLPVEVNGTTRPIREANLAPAMTARIEQIRVEEGQEVKKGAVLVRLDADTARLNAKQAESSAAAARAQAKQLESDYERLKPLAERDSIPQSRVDQLRSQKEAARAQAAAAEAAARAARQAARNATLRAPFSGTVVDVPVEVGEMASMAPASTLVRIIDLSSLEVRVQVHEKNLARIAEGDPVTASFPSLSETAEGKVERIALEVDPNTRTAEVIARVPNPERSLRGGLFTELRIHPSESRSAMVVPKTAVAGSEGDRFCYVIEEGTARRREVETTPFDADRVEILGGLEEGEVIVKDDLDRISDETEVSTEEPAEQADEAR